MAIDIPLILATLSCLALLLLGLFLYAFTNSPFTLILVLFLPPTVTSIVKVKL